MNEHLGMNTIISAYSIKACLGKLREGGDYHRQLPQPEHYVQWHGAHIAFGK